MTVTKSETSTSSAAPAPAGLARLQDLTRPHISNRAVYPAHHTITEGLSPWKLAGDSVLRATLRELTWTVVSYGATRPVGDGSVVATETHLTVEVSATKADGTVARMDDCICVLRTELDDRSLADRQLTGQGWLLPIGYTVVVDTPIA